MPWTALAPFEPHEPIKPDMETLDRWLAASTHRLFNVREAPYEAMGDGTRDDTDAFRRALEDAHESGGGVVYVPPGVYLTGPLRLKNRVALVGAHWWASRLRLKDGANTHFLGNHVSGDGRTDPNGKLIRIASLFLDCNGDRQTSGNGIHLESNPPWEWASGADINWDPRQTIERVWIDNARDHGLSVQGLSSSRFIDVHVKGCGAIGYVCGSDANFVSCEAETTGEAGFDVSGSSVRLVQCKAFNAGARTPAAGHGFHCASNQGGVSLVNCEAQDNTAHGFFLNGARRVILQGCVADSNNRRQQAGAFAGLRLHDTTHAIIDVVGYERAMDGNGDRQRHTLEITGASAGNVIRLNHSAANNATLDTAVKGEVPPGNSVTVNGGVEGSQGIATPGIGDTVTPDPYQYQHLLVVMPPGALGGLAAPVNGHRGCRLRLTFTQDETGGRGHGAWHAAYLLADGAFPASGARKRDTICFEHDGARWIETSRSVNIG